MPAASCLVACLITVKDILYDWDPLEVPPRTRPHPLLALAAAPLRGVSGARAEATSARSVSTPTARECPCSWTSSCSSRARPEARPPPAPGHRRGRGARAGRVRAGGKDGWQHRASSNFGCSRTSGNGCPRKQHAQYMGRVGDSSMCCGARPADRRMCRARHMLLRPPARRLAICFSRQ